MKRIGCIFLLLGLMVCAIIAAPKKSSNEIVVGAAQHKIYLPLLKGQKVAILSNHTGMVGDTHVLDYLLKLGVNVTAIFSPEHGFRGTAAEGEHVSSSVDEKTGIPILSLYDGKGYKPSDEAMAMFDVLITDIQDVGLRFYTYYITMARLMDACAEKGKTFVVFDRPNPNGYYVDGPILDMKFKSGVGWLPIPVVHGMTLGELALMINGEGWLTDSKMVKLHVIPCQNYTHQTRYNLPIAPSPNLRDMKAIYLYPSMCLFEGTPISLGRGTDKPFLIYGHPNYGCDGRPTNIDFTPSRSLQAGRLCHGVDLSSLSEDSVRSIGFSLRFLLDAYDALKVDNFFFSPFFEKLVGVDYVRKMIVAGKSEEEIRARWQDDVVRFKIQRQPYLLYEE